MCRSVRSSVRQPDPTSFRLAVSLSARLFYCLSASCSPFVLRLSNQSNQIADFKVSSSFFFNLHFAVAIKTHTLPLVVLFKGLLFVYLFCFLGSNRSGQHRRIYGYTDVKSRLWFRCTEDHDTAQ